MPDPGSRESRGESGGLFGPRERENPDAPALLQRVRVLRERKWIVIQSVVVLALVATYLSLQQHHKYEATASVYLGDAGLVRGLSGLPAVATSDDPLRDARTQADLARVPLVARRTLEAFGLRHRTVEQFLESSRVSPRMNSDFLDFHVSDRDPRLAVRLANEYARQFTIYRGAGERAYVEQAREQVRDALAALKSRGVRSGPLFRALSARDRDLEAMAALQVPGATVAETATNAKQVSPRPVRDISLGVVLGLVVGIALAYLFEALDTRIRSANEVADLLDLVPLGHLRAPPKRIESDRGLVMIAEPGGSHAESFRIVRANLDFANLGVGARAIMVTSAVNGEGKSTTAANLAVAYARVGRRVALVDLDLRNPALDRFFRLDGHPGVTDVALGHVELDEALAPIALGNVADEAVADDPEKETGTLHVLASGPPPPDIGEFVNASAVRTILTELRNRADLVFVDAPPLLPVGDARALSDRVDAVLVVANLVTVRRPILKEMRRVISSFPIPTLGFVLTGADADRQDRYAGFYRREPDRRRTPAPAAPR